MNEITAKGHTFHIPVMGLAFTIDTPLKVARYGISSVISIAEDVLIEQMREFHAKKAGVVFTPIATDAPDSRANRITAYLNLVHQLVNEQISAMKNSYFREGTDLYKYFELLPDSSSLKQTFNHMLSMEEGLEKKTLQEFLKSSLVAGDIDVNIMSKADRFKFTKNGDAIIDENSMALAALRGFANSNLNSSVVLSAGFNPRLYAYLENFKDFFPDEKGILKKKIILKVSDYRSALTQGKLLAKKGVWVSEFRIESGLNCGGHAFATDGILMGPILEEFKNNRISLQEELFSMCNLALVAKGTNTFSFIPTLKISVQGGVGTSLENQFLLDYHQADSIGWGSPFLLVPEATNVDEETLNQLANANKDDYYLSHASPFGIPFNNFRPSSSQQQRLQRIEKGVPGSPCYKKGLASNTEFTKEPICTASREYQHLKIKQLQAAGLPEAEYEVAYATVIEKECLCEGLAASTIVKNEIKPLHKLKAVAICPGPNLAFFSGKFTLAEMAGHIYGRFNILNQERRPHTFVNELKLYVDYYKNELNRNVAEITANKSRQLKVFHTNLLEGIAYYNKLMGNWKLDAEKFVDDMRQDLLELEAILHHLTYEKEVS